jgi:hypothetical protein
MNQEQLLFVLRSFADVLPYRAPDFSKKTVCWYWYEEFKNYSIDDLKAVVRSLIKRLDHFPSISEMHNALGSIVISDESLAQTTSISIITAIRKFGWCNESEALAYIGEFGAKVVKAYGGWVCVCDHVTNENMSYFSHQIKETAQTILRTKEKCLPELPEETKKIIACIAESVSVGSGNEKRTRDPKTDLRLALKGKVQMLEELPWAYDD